MDVVVDVVVVERRVSENVDVVSRERDFVL